MDSMERIVCERERERDVFVLARGGDEGEANNVHERKRVGRRKLECV